MRLSGFALLIILLLLSSCARQSTSAPINQNLGFVKSFMPKSATNTDIRVIHFSDRSVGFEVADGLAYFEGDIVLGKIADIEALAGKGLSTQAIGLTSNTVLHDKLWEIRVVPYAISGTFSATAKQFIKDAIKHWEDKTPIHFIPRTNQADYIRFVMGSGCSSVVGKQGGQQIITLEEACGFGAAVHEIGHSMGYWHEQSRCNRDAFLQINFDNIQPGAEPNFDKICAEGIQIGGYDYDSIMH